MRILAAFLLCVVILGGVWQYTRPSASILSQHAGNTRANAIDGAWTLEIVSTLPLGPDPFGPQAKAAANPGLTVRIDNATLQEFLHIDAASTTTIPLPPPRGPFEAMLAAAPLSGDAGALRARIYRDAIPLAEATIWTEAGAPLFLALPCDPAPEAPHGR